MDVVSTAARAAALQKAGYRCEFVGEGKRRCAARRGMLEIDHVRAKAHGGSSDLSNLQVLCKAHNLRKAELDMGEEFIRTKIAGFTAHAPNSGGKSIDRDE